MMYEGHGLAVLLLSSIGGYWVLERASTHKGSLKRVGGILGGAIIVLSLGAVLYKVLCATAACRANAMKSGSYCPFMGSMMGSKAPGAK